MEDVWSVPVYQDAVTIELVECIPRNVLAPVDNHHAHSGRRASLCDHAAGKPGAHNKNIGSHSVNLTWISHKPKAQR